MFSHFCGLNLSRNHNEKYRTMKPASRHFRNLSFSYVMYSSLYCTGATLNLFFLSYFWCFLNENSSSVDLLGISLFVTYGSIGFSFEIIREVCTKACFFLFFFLGHSRESCRCWLLGTSQRPHKQKWNIRAFEKFTISFREDCTN